MDFRTPRAGYGPHTLNSGQLSPTRQRVHVKLPELSPDDNLPSYLLLFSAQSLSINRLSRTISRQLWCIVQVRMKAIVIFGVKLFTLMSALVPNWRCAYGLKICFRMEVSLTNGIFAAERKDCFRLEALLANGKFASGRKLCFRMEALLSNGSFVSERNICFRKEGLFLGESFASPSKICFPMEHLLPNGSIIESSAPERNLQIHT